MYTPKNRILYLSQLALLVAIELVMKLVGLGSVPIGPLSMSFLTVPIAVAAILLGPFAGAVTGVVSFRRVLDRLADGCNDRRVTR